MKKKELKRENEQLRREMGILIEDPDSPEAAAIKMQWYFAQEIKKGFEGGNIDIPKLLGLYGKMMNPVTKEDSLDATIDRIIAHQNDSSLHPLTCGNDSTHTPLVPVLEGHKVVLICPDCDYRQTNIPLL